MVIGSGRGKRGYVKYACPSHRYRGVCSNKLTIRQDRLEEQLLAALEDRLLKPEIFEYVIQRINIELRHRLAEINKRGKHTADLQVQRRDLQAQAQRLVSAIAKSSDSPSLLSGLAAVESTLAQLDQQLKAHCPFDLEGATFEMREFVSKNLLQLRTFLAGDPASAKSALSKHIKQLVLTPTQLATGPVLFSGQAFDYIITVCDHAKELCPVFPGETKHFHWSIDDPAAVQGSDEVRKAAFRNIRDELHERIRGFLWARPHLYSTRTLQAQSFVIG